MRRVPIILAAWLVSAVATPATKVYDFSADQCKLPQGAACSSTTEGYVCWDTDDNRLYVGDGAAAALVCMSGGTCVASSATALAANGANCAAGEAAAGVDASGAAEGCAAYQVGPLSGDVVTSGAVATIQANSVALTTDTTGNYAAGDAEAGNVAADKVLESSLKAVDAAADEECLTYESTTGDFEWHACSSGVGAGLDEEAAHFGTIAEYNSTLYNSFGYSATVNVLGVSTNNAIDANGIWFTTTSAAVSSAAAVMYVGAVLQRRHGFAGVISIETDGTVTNTRYFIGYSSNGGTHGSSDTPALHYCAVRRSTSVPDTNWQCVTDNASAAPTVTDTGVSFAASTRYTVRIEGDNSQCRCCVNSTCVTNTTTLPTSTTGLGWMASVTTLAASARTLYFNRALTRRQ